jgi:hypothetical protein
MKLLALTLLITVLSGGAGERPPLHDIHVSHTRMVVEGDYVLLRIRMFKDDLEQALEPIRAQPGRALSADDAAVEAFTEYLTSTLQLSTPGSSRLAPTVLGYGEEPADDIWWYEVQYRAEAPIASLTISSRLFFELFDDQRNIVRLRHFPSEASHIFYFVVGDDAHSITFPG